MKYISMLLKFKSVFSFWSTDKFTHTCWVYTLTCWWLVLHQLFQSPWMPYLIRPSSKQSPSEDHLCHLQWDRSHLKSKTSFLRIKANKWKWTPTKATVCPINLDKPKARTKLILFVISMNISLKIQTWLP